jgi:hypothetical protein
MSWASKLESKLSLLTEASSQESVATVAKWICFNRKHAESFCQVLGDKVSAAGGQQMIMIDLISSVLLNDKGSSAWERGADLRRMIQEKVLLPNLERLTESSRDKVLLLTKDWDEANVFGGPAVIHQIRKKISVKTLEMQDGVKPSFAKAEAREPQKRQAEPSQEKPVPFVKTEPYQLLESCGQVANLQIARDIRNDSSIQLNSFFTALPEDVRRSCADAAETEGDYALPDDDIARDYSSRINQTLIDMDMNEQLLNLYQLRKLIEQQREARQNALKLLIQSRCKFGSDEAAAAFYTANRGTEELSNRRQILLDAMELEGCGLEDEDDNEQQKTSNETELEPLTWYKPDTLVNAEE